MFGLGITEIAVILVIALLVIGPDKLPEVAKSLGKGLRELRKATDEIRDSVQGTISGAVREVAGKPPVAGPPMAHPLPGTGLNSPTAAVPLPAPAPAADPAQPVAAFPYPAPWMPKPEAEPPPAPTPTTVAELATPAPPSSLVQPVEGERVPQEKGGKVS